MSGIDFTHHAGLWINNDEATYRHWTARAKRVCPDVYRGDASRAPVPAAEPMFRRRRAMALIGIEMNGVALRQAEALNVEGMMGELLRLAVMAVDWDEVAEPYVDAWIEENRPSSTGTE